MSGARLSESDKALLAEKGLGFLVDTIEQTQRDADRAFVIHAAALVFLMQCGFAMLTVGCVRTKNTKYILLKNLLDSCASALGFWAVGYGIAYGASEGGNPIIGNEYFFLVGFPMEDAHLWFFQFAFAATAATIVSGAVAERTKLVAYMLYSGFLTAFVYPVVVHWVWSRAGWLSPTRVSPLFGVGLVDFAGSTVVHVVGGLSALIGAWVAGPRIGRYTADGKLVDIPGHSTTFQALGTFILWVGWYGFNPGSTLGVTGKSVVASRAALTTTISAASSAVSAVVMVKLARKVQFDLSLALNGALAGLVSITAGCAVVEPYAAVAIGVGGAAAYVGWSEFVKRVLKIDDVVDASAVHFACGVWGTLATALFATQEGLASAYDLEAPRFYGAFYAPAGQAHQLVATAMVGMAAVCGWVAALMVPFFLGLKASGLLRIPAVNEEIGMDAPRRGGMPFTHLAADGTTPKPEGE